MEEWAYLPEANEITWILTNDNVKRCPKWVSGMMVFDGDVVYYHENFYKASNKFYKNKFNRPQYLVYPQWRKHSKYHVSDIVHYKGFFYECKLSHDAKKININPDGTIRKKCCLSWNFI